MRGSKTASGLLIAALAIPGLAQQPRHVERVEVSRILIDARVVDGSGTPILGLGVDDFRVKIAGKVARVESVQWVEGGLDETKDGGLDSTEIRGAVLSFDSHLKVWLDFTNDLDDVRPLFERGILLERPGPVQQAPPPSLVARLDPARARRSHSVEEALHLIGEALEPLPGSKSIVFVGHGFGDLGPMGVSMVNGYEETRAVLQKARVSVFRRVSET